MGVQGLFPLTHWHSSALTSVHGLFSTHSKVFKRTHKHSGGVHYWLKDVQVHSQAFKGCSILTQMSSCALTSIQGVFSSDTNENFLMVPPWWVMFNNDSKVIMLTQWVFTLTQWQSCTLNGCSETVQYSLIGIHVHTMDFHGVFNTHSLVLTCTHTHLKGVQYSLFGIHFHSHVFRKCSIHVQPVHVPEGRMNKFSNLRKPHRPYELALNFHWMPFLVFGQARRHDVTLESMIRRWSWCQPMRLPTQNMKVLQKVRKWDIFFYNFVIKPLIFSKDESA
jgi:hypothetical protein